MTYTEFNSKALQYYVQRFKSTFCTFSVDSAELSELVIPEQIKQFKILKSSWDNLLRIDNGIPQYFGLIAIQCYAASLMHDDGENASDAYQIRLMELLDLDEYNDLQKLFRGTFSLDPVQEKIWFNAKKFFLENFNQIIDLPSPTIYAGRYVQFPKSQVLLTVEDLKRFTQFFYSEFKINEIISLKYFIQRLEASLANIQLTNRVEKLLHIEQKREMCYKQLYNYYNNWDGSVYQISGRRNPPVDLDSRKSIELTFGNLLLEVDEQLVSFYLITEKVENIPFSKLFNIPGYKYIRRNMIFFTPTEFNTNEFKDSSFLYENQTQYILLNATSKNEYYQYLQSHSLEIIHLENAYTLYRINLSSYDKYSPFRSFLEKIHPVHLQGGLKISRKNEYYFGFGPEIESKLSFIVLNNYYRCEYNPNRADPGIYMVRIDNYKDLEFIIAKESCATNFISPRNLGWDRDLNISGIEYLIEGCIVKKSVDRSMHPIRKWINGILERQYPNILQYSNH